MKKYLIGTLLLCLIGTNLIGCSEKKVEITNSNNTTIEITDKNVIDELILKYNEKGIDLLKADFTDVDDLLLALKNIGNEVSGTYSLLNGKTIDFSNLKGKKIILEVNQTDCTACRELTPMVHNKVNEMEDIEIIPVFVNSTDEEVRTFLTEFNLTENSTVIMDKDKSFINDYSVKFTPSLIFIDESGKISYVKQNVVDEVELEDAFNRAYNEDKIYDMLAE